MAKSRRQPKNTPTEDPIQVEEAVEEEAVNTPEEVPAEPTEEVTPDVAEAVEPPAFVEDEPNGEAEETAPAPTAPAKEADGRDSAAAEEQVAEAEICESLNKDIMVKLSNQSPVFPRSAPDAAASKAAGYVPIRMLKTLLTPPMMKSKSFTFRWIAEFPHCQEGQIYLVPQNVAGVLISNGSAFGG